MECRGGGQYLGDKGCAHFRELQAELLQPLPFAFQSPQRQLWAALTGVGATIPSH